MKKEIVYLVRQTQPNADYFRETIAVFTKKADALALARGLNQEYGSGCAFNNNWDFIELGTCEDLQYYDVYVLETNPDIKNFF